VIKDGFTLTDKDHIGSILYEDRNFPGIHFSAHKSWLNGAAVSTEVIKNGRERPAEDEIHPDSDTPRSLPD